MNRRDFLKNTAAVGAASAVPGVLTAETRDDKLYIGGEQTKEFIGFNAQEELDHDAIKRAAEVMESGGDPHIVSFHRRPANRFFVNKEEFHAHAAEYFGRINKNGST